MQLHFSGVSRLYYTRSFTEIYENLYGTWNKRYHIKSIDGETNPVTTQNVFEIVNNPACLIRIDYLSRFHTGVNWAGSIMAGLSAKSGPPIKRTQIGIWVHIYAVCLILKNMHAFLPKTKARIKDLEASESGETLCFWDRDDFVVAHWALKAWKFKHCL